MVNLFIDTRDNKRVVARIEKGEEKFEVVSDSATQRPESILNLIDKACSDAKITLDQLDEITIEEGPGSYTGLKVGASVANALSFSLGRSVNTKTLGEIVVPKYE